MLSQSDLPEIVPSVEGNVSSNVQSLTPVPGGVVIAAGIPSESSRIKKLMREKALVKIKNDLEKFNKNKIIREVLTNLSTIQLSCMEGNREDTDKVNQYLREILLKILPLEHENFNQIKLHNAVLHSLLLLANYWPLNDYELNETGTDGSYVCTISGERLDANNRILFATGGQLHISFITRYYDFSLEHDFRDPHSQKLLPNLCFINFIAKNPAYVSNYISSHAYTVNKKLEMESKAANWRTIGGIIPIVLLGILLVTSLLVAPIIPPLAILIAGLALGMGSALTSKIGAVLGYRSKERHFEKFEKELRTNALVDHKEINRTIEVINTAAKSEIEASSDQAELVISREVPVLPAPSVSTAVLQNSTAVVQEVLDAKDEGLDLKKLAKTHTSREMAVFSAQKRLSLFKKASVQVQPLSSPTTIPLNPSVGSVGNKR